MPRVPRLRSATAEVIGILLVKLARSPPDGYIAEHDAACCHASFDIAEAQRKPKIQPDCMGNDVGGVAVALVGWGNSVRLHAISIAQVAAMNNEWLM